MHTRIPILAAADLPAARQWFTQLHALGLLFHPDDDPRDIIQISSGKPTFSAKESTLLSQIIDRLIAELGDQVYDLALEAVGKTSRISADASVCQE